MEQSDTNKDYICTGHWFYSKPCFTPNKDGDIVLVFQYSMGPLEWWQWRIDSQGRYVMEYKWCENDFYEDENFMEFITKEEMIEKMQKMQRLFAQSEEWESFVEAYKEAEEFVGGKHR